MPVTRPADKADDQSQWWKDEPMPEGDVPEGPAANNKDGQGKNKFDQEQHPVRRPT